MELREGMRSMSLDGSGVAAPLPGVNGDWLGRVGYVAVLPNLLLSLHPDYVMTHRLTPLDAGTTHVECCWLFAPEEVAARPGFDPSNAVDFWDLTNRQDWAACESVQRGLASPGYEPGPLCADEADVHRFVAMMARLYATGSSAL
jgi:Rieske 2Fe-2S family protein